MTILEAAVSLLAGVISAAIPFIVPAVIAWARTNTQSALGQVWQEAGINAMGRTMTAMAEWAAANPALALNRSAWLQQFTMVANREAAASMQMLPDTARKLGKSHGDMLELVKAKAGASGAIPQQDAAI